jgi:putative nucleotidyltransferase with HDIG domain
MPGASPNGLVLPVAAIPGFDATVPAWLRSDHLSVPMLPALAHRVIEMATDPDLSVHTLSALVAKDQVLAARVLGLANSAYSSPSRTISSLTQAIVRLGTAAVRNVVITVSFTSRFQDPAVYLGRGKAIVDHAIGTAYVARIVAEQARVDLEGAFLYGLIHDIGKLVILKRAHDCRRQSGGTPTEEEVAAAVRDHHPAAGAIVLHRWKLPPSLEDPVLYHHDHLSAPRFAREAAVAYLANRLSHRYGFGCERDPGDVLVDPVCQQLGVDSTWLAGIDARAPGLYDVARHFID